LRLALVLVLVACGGGSEKPPVTPQPPPPDAAVAVVENPPVEEEGPEPQALPPADVGEEQGLMRKPRQPAPSPSSSVAPASMAGYPPSCVAYMSMFLKLAECDKLGPAKDSMKQAYEATVDAWKDMAQAADPDARKAWDDGCKAGLDGIKQTADAMGCSL
jgi:hypothetical protein